MMPLGLPCLISYQSRQDLAVQAVGSVGGDIGQLGLFVS